MLKPLDMKGWEHTAWCVPSAIAMITGAPVAHMHSRAAFMQQIAAKEVKGVFTEETILLLREQGYKVQQIDLYSRYNGKCPTIQRFLNERTTYEKCMPVIFTTPDHMMCAQYGYAGDNWTKKPVPVEQFPKPRRKVDGAWIVLKA